MAGVSPDDLSPAEHAILAKLRDGQWACQPMAVLVRAGNAVGGNGSGKPAVAALVAGGWIEEWRPPIKCPAIMTLTPLGAERLDWALIQPAKDSQDEPTWGYAGVDIKQGVYDHPVKGSGRPVGLYASEPDCFLIVETLKDSDGNAMKRSLTPFETIAKARACRRAAAATLLSDYLLDNETGEPVVIMGQTVKRDRRIKPAVAPEASAPTPKGKAVVKATVVLAYRNGKTAAELGEVFGVSEGTIRRWDRETA